MKKLIVITLIFLSLFQTILGQEKNEIDFDFSWKDRHTVTQYILIALSMWHF